MSLIFIGVPRNAAALNALRVENTALTQTTPFLDTYNVPPLSSLPANFRHEVKTGEYGDLLKTYNALAQKMGLPNPPKLFVVGGTVTENGGGGLSTPERIPLAGKLLAELTPGEKRQLMAHELGHELQRRNNEQFKSAEDGEADATFKALKVTGDLGSVISLIYKIAKIKSDELPEVMQKILKKFAEAQHMDPATLALSEQEIIKGRKMIEVEADKVLEHILAGKLPSELYPAGDKPQKTLGPTSDVPVDAPKSKVTVLKP